MNASWTAPAVSGASTAPVDMSTARNTMFAGDWNSGGMSLSGRPSMYAFINSIQIGSAASDPCSAAPSDFFSSNPSQTPTVMSGSNPMNQASVLSSTVPVLPASGQSAAMLAAR